MQKGVWYCWVLLLVGCASGNPHGETRPATASEPSQGPIDPVKTQLVTVVSNEWDNFRAELRRYERSADQRWKPVGSPIDVVLGHGGYGWGRGVHGDGPPVGRSGPIKREGDGRSPAGVFEIGTAYGYEAALKGVSLRYVQATSKLRCVDDPRSRHYNRIVSTAITTLDWKSAEQMRRRDDTYAIAIVVEHNTRQTEPGAGSCIFIHVWRGPDTAMTGCTAMPMETLEAFAGWLEPNAAVLVALPRSEYSALESAWGLP